MNDETAAKLFEIEERLGDREDQDALDIDWLLGQVAMLQANITALEKQLSDAQDIAGAMYLRLGVQNG
jgi:hypothetical protein